MTDVESQYLVQAEEGESLFPERFRTKAAQLKFDFQLSLWHSEDSWLKRMCSVPRLSRWGGCILPDKPLRVIGICSMSK